MMGERVVLGCRWRGAMISEEGFREWGSARDIVVFLKNFWFEVFVVCFE